MNISNVIEAICLCCPSNVTSLHPLSINDQCKPSARSRMLFVQIQSLFNFLRTSLLVHRLESHHRAMSYIYIYMHIYIYVHLYLIFPRLSQNLLFFPLWTAVVRLWRREVRRQAVMPSSPACVWTVCWILPRRSSCLTADYLLKCMILDQIQSEPCRSWGSIWSNLFSYVGAYVCYLQGKWCLLDN